MVDERCTHKFVQPNTQLFEITVVGNTTWENFTRVILHPNKITNLSVR